MTESAIDKVKTKESPWVHKYAPKHTKDVVGHVDAIAQIKHYLEHYKPGQKPILLHGKPGIGVAPGARLGDEPGPALR